MDLDLLDPRPGDPLERRQVGDVRLPALAAVGRPGDLGVVRDIEGPGVAAGDGEVLDEAVGDDDLEGFRKVMDAIAEATRIDLRTGSKT